MKNPLCNLGSHLPVCFLHFRWFSKNYPPPPLLLQQYETFLHHIKTSFLTKNYIICKAGYSRDLESHDVFQFFDK